MIPGQRVVVIRRAAIIRRVKVVRGLVAGAFVGSTFVALYLWAFRGWGGSIFIPSVIEAQILGIANAWLVGVERQVGWSMELSLAASLDHLTTVESRIPRRRVDTSLEPQLVSVAEPDPSEGEQRGERADPGRPGELAGADRGRAARGRGARDERH